MFLDNLNYHVLGEGVICILSAVLTFNIIASFTPTERRQRLFLYGGISSFLSTLFNILAVLCITYYDRIPTSLGTFVSSIYFFFLVIIPLVLSDYAVDVAFAYKEKLKKWVFRINGCIYVVYGIILFLNFFTGWIFSYDSTAGYIRGPLKLITYVLTLFYSTITLISVLFNRKVMAKRLFWVFLIYPFLAIFIMSVQFVFNTILLTGTASFATLLLAYITIQSDMLEFDIISGLMTEAKLQKHLDMNNKGVLYTIQIENKALLQNVLDVSDINKIMLDLGKEMLKVFERHAYHLSDNRFSGIARNLDEVKEKNTKVQFIIKQMNDVLIKQYGIQMDVYCVAIEFAEGNKTYNAVLEIMNNLFAKAKRDLNHELYFCNESVLVDMERKRVIYKILQRELNLNSNQLQVWYQPIYSISDNKFTYMEALARLKDTEIGDISPQEFVAVAENKGLIEKLGFVVFEKICKYISENKDVVNAVSVNFSVYQMTNPNIVRNVLMTIEKFGLNPSHIIMEITESIFIDNFEIVYKNMKELANAGIHFYLDDFGTGYSNLANVVKLPFTTIKIDRSLVLMMEESQKNIEFFNNLVETFKDADFKILVEGVETQNQNYLVQKVGVDYIQGFLYSRPINEEKCLELLRKQEEISN